MKAESGYTPSTLTSEAKMAKEQEIRGRIRMLRETSRLIPKDQPGTRHELAVELLHFRRKLRTLAKTRRFLRRTDEGRGDSADGVGS